MKNDEKGIPEENQIAIQALSARVHQLESMPIKNALPVGSILLSALSKATFQAQYDGTWVPCHGQEIEGFGKVPDLQDRFPRVVADEEKLGGIQADATAVKNLKMIVGYTPGKIKAEKTVIGSTDKPGYANLKMWETDTPAVPGSTWRFFHKPAGRIKSEYGHCIFGSGSETEGRLYGSHGNQKIFRDTGHDHSFTGSVSLDENVMDSSVTCELKSSDNETRPKSCYINAFIRVG